MPKSDLRPGSVYIGGLEYICLRSSYRMPSRGFYTSFPVWLWPTRSWQWQEGTKLSAGSTILVLCRTPIGSDRLEWGAHDLCQAWALRISRGVWRRVQFMLVVPADTSLVSWSVFLQGDLARAISPLAGRVFLARIFQRLASLECTRVFWKTR